MTSNPKKLADYIQVRGRYRRSVNLVKDFFNSNQNGEFIVTPTAREAIRRLSEGLGNGSPFRAWTLTGPYGTGKSAFAVFLTSLLTTSGKQSQQAKSKLIQADPLFTNQLDELGLLSEDSKGFLPILATARRTSASKCLAEGIIAAASLINDRKANTHVRKLKASFKTQLNGQPIDTRVIIDAVSSIAEAATASGYHGVLIIVDELGKLFEYAARYPQKGDVYVFQELAEHAARSTNHPIVLVGLLHQSFQEYGMHLDLATRREWAKIQGRFEDIAFLEPIDQVIRMIAQAITWNGGNQKEYPPQYLSLIAKQAQEAGLAPIGMQPTDFEKTVTAAYPLHPVTLVALPYIFRRFAQNERSLFSYLSSLEPYGFQEFIQSEVFNPDSPPVIRIRHLFDYFTKNFGAGLYRHPHALRWMEASDVLDRKDELSPLHREVVKTIGVLNALGEFCPLNASEEIVSLAITDSCKTNKELRKALSDLQEASIITFRKFNHTYRIWEGSDIDIEERIAEGERKIRQGLNLASSVKRYLPQRPLVARRHSFLTGALRYFQFEYIDIPEDFQTHLDISDADGKIIVCLAESPIVAEQFRVQASKHQERSDILWAIPQFTGELRAIVIELGALRWAWDNTPGLRDDRVARREMSLRISEAEQMLQRNIEGLLDPRDEPVGSGCLWIHKGEVASVARQVEVSQLLSDVCDETYHKSPRIRNELIVRRNLSSAAVAARRNLIDRMLNHHDEETLGIEGYPPERSMYESVLKATGIHRQDYNSKWRFLSPDNRNDSEIVFAWDCIRDELFLRQPEPLQVTHLFRTLSDPPYGVMPGLHPVLLCAFMLSNPDETTLYREGTFLPEPGIADFEILMRRPELYSIGGSRVMGGRAAVVQRLASGLNVRPATVPVVRALYQMVKNLPSFAWNTRRLRPETLALRDVFQTARSPEQFLFINLPEALGLSPFSEAEGSQEDINVFFDALNENLRQLVTVTGTIINRARDTLLKACGFQDGAENWQKLRSAALELEPAVTEPRLLTFLKRLTQSGSDLSGVESVIALIANRPPRNWADYDADRFPEAANLIGKSFQEAVRAASIAPNTDSQLAALSPKERIQAEDLFAKVKKFLDRNAIDSSPRALRLAITRLLEELNDE